MCEPSNQAMERTATRCDIPLFLSSDAFTSIHARSRWPSLIVFSLGLMQRITVFIALSIASTALVLPDDLKLSRRIVGRWHEYRHDTRYFADGTYLADPTYNPPNARTGKWRIQGGLLIETWRFQGADADSTVVYQIIQLDHDVMRFRTLSQDGPFRPPGLVPFLAASTRGHVSLAMKRRPNQTLQPTPSRRIKG